MNKYRHEYKYILNKKQEVLLLFRAKAFLGLDSYASKKGSYYIHSLYFDDINNKLFYENEDGTDPRSKYRIRYYNEDSDRLKLEKKSKRSGMTLKESCSLTKGEVEEYINGRYPSINEQMKPEKKKLLTEIMMNGLKPKVVVSYERVPFVYKAGNVRVTFDRNISSSVDIKNFLSPNRVTRTIMEKGKSVLEVKWDELLPKHIKDILNVDFLERTAFSKYALCRKYSNDGGMK